MTLENLSTIVIGSINTDIVGLGFPSLLGSGEIGYGERVLIGPGGKSRNIAQMIAALSGSGKVAMIGRTTQDPFGLWRTPVDALISAGVDCQGVRFVRFDPDGSWPGLALISVDCQGKQHIYVIEGVNSQFSPEDIEVNDQLFRAASQNDGCLVATMELPVGTAIYGIEKAKRHGLKVLLDPGGMRCGVDYSPVVSSDVFLFKPNEQEAEIITGGRVTDLKSAKRIAVALTKLGPQNVLLTMAEQGAVLANADGVTHIPVPFVNGGDARDATGCGDQVMAAICSSLLDGKSVIDACMLAVRAGTLQFYREGIVPVRELELVD